MLRGVAIMHETGEDNEKGEFFAPVRLLSCTKLFVSCSMR